MLLEQLAPGEGIPGALKEQHRHIDITELLDPQLLRLARGMKRVGVENQPVGRCSLRYDVGSDPAPHRPACQEEPVYLASEELGRLPVARDELLCPIRALRAALCIRVVEREHGVTGVGEAVTEQDHEPVILIRARSVCEQYSVGAFPGHAAGDLSSVPGDPNCAHRPWNVDHRVTVSGMEAVVHDSPDALADAAAQHISRLIRSTDGRFSLGLAGGSTPASTYERLRSADVEWTAVDAWLSDERWVPPEDERSNGRMARELLADHVDVAFHRPIWGDFVQADDAAAHYEAKLRSIHAETKPPDLILLGLGDDGHTASLFPDTKALAERRRWFVANFVPQQDELRLTATFPLLRSAREIMFLVVGAGKAEAVRDSFSGTTPAGQLGEAEGKVTWHLDTEAASLLS